MATKEEIKQLRDQTGLSFMQCRKALDEAEGDMEKAMLLLRKASSKAASKKADRELGAGTIRSYIHGNGQVGVLLELNCETDFVAKNEEFLKLADNISMHIAAMNPKFLSTEEITDEDKAKITEVMQEEVDAMDKPDDIKAKVLEGKLNDYFAQQTLLEQAYVKNPDQTVGKLIEEGIQKIGEKIEIGRFVRYGVLEA